MDNYQLFFDHMMSQLPESFGETLTGSDADVAVCAAYLWSLLQMIQDDLNALSRRTQHCRLGAMSVETINKAFAQVRELIDDEEKTCFLPVLDYANPPTHADALISVASYKQALRRYRVEVLREDPFRFR